ncbi:MAG: hypothetical protein M3512_13405 [Bacteroidota bacterium]|nr:hypothetical protein [Bacteroidota bacterium]MDQ3534491.1 hypothetical protein [Bacteroidota bacterium]
MGHIKEPKGIDFIIESKPLTVEERKKISEFIRKDKEKPTSKGKLSSTNKTSKKIETAD